MTNNNEIKIYRSKDTGYLYLQRNALDSQHFEEVEILKPGHIQIDVSEVDVSKISLAECNFGLNYLKSRPYHNNYIVRLVFDAMQEKQDIEEPETGFVEVVDDDYVKTRFVRIAADGIEHWLDLDSEDVIDWETLKSLGTVTLGEQVISWETF